MFEPMSRRTVLKGLGTAVALPFLEAMLPKLATAANPAVAPKRMAFLYVPNGIHMQDWTPEKDGAEVCEAIRGEVPRARILIVSSSSACILCTPRACRQTASDIGKR